ncbi:MAG: hypothetical protein ACRDF4_08175, partial [Rhabdochlamydiaceae bacterium]
EASRILGDQTWYDKAEEIARTLLIMSNSKENGVFWLVGGLKYPIADLMVGSGGVVHFLLSLKSKGDIRFPLTLRSEAIRDPHF